MLIVPPSPRPLNRAFVCKQRDGSGLVGPSGRCLLSVLARGQNIPRRREQGQVALWSRLPRHPGPLLHPGRVSERAKRVYDSVFDRLRGPERLTQLSALLPGFCLPVLTANTANTAVTTVDVDSFREVALFH